MKHVPALDGVRGVALGLVLAHQLWLIDGPAPLAVRLVRPFLEVGWAGVTLFFVLSGYLITGILVDSKGRPGWLRAFYARRALRIFPLYYAVLFVRFLLLPALGARLPGAHQAWYWAYLANWSAPLGRGVAGFGHFWSLCVEEQFYLVWPFLVLALDRRALARACLVIAALALAARCALVAAGQPEMAYSFTVCRMDALAAGGLLALVMRAPAARALVERNLGRIAAAAVAASVAIGAVSRALPRVGAWTETVGYLVLDLDFAVVVCAAALGRPGLLAARPLRTLGKYSYAMYVLHLPLGMWAAPRVRALLAGGDAARLLAVQLAYLVVMTLALLALALISWTFLEKPMLGLKRRFEV